MKLNKWVKVILIGTSIVALAACSRKHHDQSAINDANASYASGDAQSSGLGQESTFGDQAGGAGSQARTGRVYYFDYDSNIVRPEFVAPITKNANYLASHPNAQVIVEGHTDPRGSREYNIGLGERRAKAVANMLVAKGANPNQLRIVSYGSEKLAAPGYTEADYQLDRRVVLTYTQR